MGRLLFASLFTLGLIFGQTTESRLPVSADSSDLARTLLRNSLRDRNPDTRKHAVQALGLLNTSGPWLTELEAMLDDKDVEVRLAVIASLVDLKGSRSVATLQKVLGSNVPEVSFAAAKALWMLGDPSGREALESALNGKTKTSSGFLTKKKREARRMMRTPKTMFMFAVMQGANFAPVPGVGGGISSVQGILSDSGSAGRAVAALLLSTEMSPGVLEALRGALDDSAWSVRAAAVHAIAIRNESSLQADLIPLLDDKKDAVRVRAAAGYLRLEALKSVRAAR